MQREKVTFSSSLWLLCLMFGQAERFCYLPSLELGVGKWNDNLYHVLCTSLVLPVLCSTSYMMGEWCMIVTVHVKVKIRVKTS